MERLKSAMKVLHELMGMDMEKYEAMYGEKKPNPEMKKSGIDDKINKGVVNIMKFDDILKSLSDEQQAAIVAEIEKKALEAVNKSKPTEDVTTIQKQLDEVSKANVQLVKALEVERDIRITKDFVEKAKTYNALPGVEVEAFGKMLKDLSQKAPEQYAELVKTLDASNEMISKNNALMTEFGGNEPPESDALNKLNAITAEIQKADPKMTYHVAFGKAMSANPKLYDEYLKQK
jgi:hypothetical protein